MIKEQVLLIQDHPPGKQDKTHGNCHVSVPAALELFMVDLWIHVRIPGKENDVIRVSFRKKNIIYRHRPQIALQEKLDTMARAGDKLGRHPTQSGNRMEKVNKT